MSNGNFRPLLNISYPPELPVSERKDEIAAAILAHQVVVVAGATGSGKTTQLPKICLELGRGQNAMIGHTQPRRLAARSVADRIAQELGTKLGQIVGYQVRFTDVVSRKTRVKLMTDGIMLAEIRTDPLLTRYDTIIIDEAHERSLNIDFLLGYMARLLPQRPDLKLIITSATIDAQRFASHFASLEGVGEVPVIEVSGRTYPVQIRYRPLDKPEADLPSEYTSQSSPADEDFLPADEGSSAPADKTSLDQRYYSPDGLDQIDGIIAALDELERESDGSVLVFLSSEREIKDCEIALNGHYGPRYVKHEELRLPPRAVEVLPLYARLSPAEQQRIFSPARCRRIILATNVAETSLTVPGIKYVVDPGLARISRYSNRTKVQRLPIEEISKASANQRSGRCGRTSPGIAIRLYSHENFEARDDYTEPEILRTSLASVILQMANLNLGRVEDFPFLDAPDPRAVRDGEQLLKELGALRVPADEPAHAEAGAAAQKRTGPQGQGQDVCVGYQLTSLGRKIAHLPIDPRLARILIAAQEKACVNEALVIVSALAMQDVRLRPLEAAASADNYHRRFLDPNSDFVSFLNLWKYLKYQQRELSNSAFRRLARDEYLHYLRIREWQDLHAQLRQVMATVPGREAGREAGREKTRRVADAKQQRGTANEAKRRFSPGNYDLRLPDRRNVSPSEHSEALCSMLVADTKDHVDYAGLHQALLTGMLSLFGHYDGAKKLYLGPRGVQFYPWPGSALASRTYEWIMAGELVETSRVFARNIAKIEPEWLEKVGYHLLKRSYGEPYWSSNRCTALIGERTSLYGVSLGGDKPVALASLKNRPLKALSLPLSLAGALGGWDAFIGSGASQSGAQEIFVRHLPETAEQWARWLFIRYGLVEGQARLNYPFLKHNAKALESVRELEKRSRSAGRAADETLLTLFYAARIGAKCTNPQSFANWYRRTGSKVDLNFPPGLLWQDSAIETLLADYHSSEGAAASDAAVSHDVRTHLENAGYPDFWTQPGVKLRVKYKFSPGQSGDGITIEVGLSQLALLADSAFEWLVPGMWEELFVSLLRALPKQIRRDLPPAPGLGEKMLAWIKNCLAQGTYSREVWLHENAGNTTSADGSQTPAQLKQAQELSSSLARLAQWSGAKVSRSKEQVPADEVSRAGYAESASDPAKATSTPAPPCTNSSALEKPALDSPWDCHVHTAPPVPLFALFARAFDECAARQLSETDFLSAYAALPQHLRPRFSVRDTQGKVHMFDSLKLARKKIGKHSQTALKNRIRASLEAGAATELALTSKKPSTAQTAPIDTSALFIAYDNPLRGADLSASEQKVSTAKLLGALRKLPLLQAQRQLADDQVKTANLGYQRITTRWNHTLKLQLVELARALNLDSHALVELLQLYTAWQLTTASDALFAPNTSAGAPNPPSAGPQTNPSGKLNLSVYEQRLYDNAQLFGQVAVQYKSTLQTLSGATSLQELARVSTLKEQANSLLTPEFALNWGELTDRLPRYLLTLAHQKAKPASTSANSDFQHALTMWESLVEKLSQAPTLTLQQARALAGSARSFEELKVSLFAQSLGTAEKISGVRFVKLLKQIGL